MRAALLAVLATVAASGCAVSRAFVPAPVPVLDDGHAGLVGVWQGTYESRETGRQGDIYFALSADGDSAAGEVVMAPRGTSVTVHRDSQGVWQWAGADPPQVLTLRFIHLRDGRVVGELNPYRDPDCGCELQTTFRGEVDGDDLFGTFESAATDPTFDAEGTWHAGRQPAAR